MNVDVAISATLLTVVACFIPAIIMLIVGLSKLKSQPENARRMIIGAIIYMIVGFGICTTIVNNTY